MRKDHEKQQEIRTDEQGCSRRDFLRTAGTLTVAGGLVGAGVLDPAALFAAVNTKRKINVGIFGPSHCAAPFVITKLNGLFEKDLEVNLINYPEMPLIAKDLISGKIEFGQLIVPLAMAINCGAKPFPSRTPLVIPQIGGINGAALMVRKGANIKNSQDFKGKSISNHSKLSVHYLLNMMFLEKQGLHVDKDVRFRVVELDNILQEVQDGSMDSFVMPEPKNSAAEISGVADPYLLSKYLWPNHPCCAMVTKRAFYEHNKALTTSVIRSFTKGGLWANQAKNREELVDRLRSVDTYKYDKVPKKVLMNAFTPGRSDFYPFPYQSSAEAIIEIMKKHQLLPGNVNQNTVAQEVFLSDLSRKIIKELGADAPMNNYRREKILGSLRDFQA